MATGARRLAQHNIRKPCLEDLSCKEATLHLYEDSNDMPAPTWTTVAAVNDDFEAAEMRSLLVGDRHEYAALQHHKHVVRQMIITGLIQCSCLLLVHYLTGAPVARACNKSILLMLALQQGAAAAAASNVGLCCRNPAAAASGL